MQKRSAICIFILSVLFSALPAFAQYQYGARFQTQLVALVDKKPIIIEAPRPFVEVSRILPDMFAQRQMSISAANRLIAWYIPLTALKEQLNEKTERHRTLQIQVMKEMEQVRYDRPALKQMYEEFVRSTPNVAVITEEDTDTLFSLLDLSGMTKKAGGQKILGLSALGPDSFTLCIATSTEGWDMRGGREVEASVACVTHLLLNDKILLLSVYGPALTAKELRNSMRLTREWISVMLDNNAIPLGAAK